MFDDVVAVLVSPSSTEPDYALPMATAESVAWELRNRLPNLPIKKLHKLLYYCQGHHLAGTGSPLFSDTISAWDMGPVVGRLWKLEHTSGPAGRSAPLDEAGLNTVGYVVSRYGRLTGLDLEHLSHAEAPWLRADEKREPGDTTRIELEWIRGYFEGEATEDSDLANSAVVADWLGRAGERRSDPLHPDSFAAVRARLVDAG